MAMLTIGYDLLLKDARIPFADRSFVSRLSAAVLLTEVRANGSGTWLPHGAVIWIGSKLTLMLGPTSIYKRR